MSDPHQPFQPARAPGLAHPLAASRHSIAGVKRLWRETAFRQELLLAVVLVVTLILRRAGIELWFTGLALILLTFAFEAFNTAIEVLTDRISPEWSEAARDAKDLGSLAVGLVLLLTFGFLAAVAFGLI